MEKEKAPGTNLGYSMVVLPKESPSAPFPAKKNLQPDIALQTQGPTEPTNSWGRRKITQVISWGKDHEDRLTHLGCSWVVGKPGWALGVPEGNARRHDGQELALKAE